MTANNALACPKSRRLLTDERPFAVMDLNCPPTNPQQLTLLFRLWDTASTHNTISANSLTAAVKSHFCHFLQKSITDPPPHPAKQCQ
jgi:hypothetical protein